MFNQKRLCVQRGKWRRTSLAWTSDRNLKHVMGQSKICFKSRYFNSIPALAYIPTNDGLSSLDHMRSYSLNICRIKAFTWGSTFRPKRNHMFPGLANLRHPLLQSFTARCREGIAHCGMALFRNQPTCSRPVPSQRQLIRQCRSAQGRLYRQEQAQMIADDGG
jgi:hypothetical protein